MFNTLLDFICPARKALRAYKKLLDDSLDISAKLAAKLQRLEGVLAEKKSKLTTTIDSLHVTSHAIHRYRERHKGKGTDDDIRKMLYKALIRQLATMNSLPDGKYQIAKNIWGQVINNTLVTVLPKHVSRGQQPN